MFLWVFGGTTFLVDMGRRPTTDPRTYLLHAASGLPSALIPLAVCDWEDVGAVHDIVVTVDLDKQPATFTVRHNWPLLAPKTKPRRRKAEESDDATGGSSHASAGERSDASGPIPEVDTDLDSGVDVPPDPNAKCNMSSESEAHGADEEHDDQASEGASGSCAAPIARGFRHPPGTWRVWESAWFYMTQRAGDTDIRMWVKACLCGGKDGMQPPLLSRALTPHNYGETPDDCPRTKFLLRCWCVWRARKGDWALTTQSRREEVAAQVVALRSDYEDLRPLAPGPALGNQAAEKVAIKWLPDIFDAAPRGSRGDRRRRDVDRG